MTTEHLPSRRPEHRSANTAADLLKIVKWLIILGLVALVVFSTAVSMAASTPLDLLT